jgi:hypothetical protein
VKQARNVVVFSFLAWKGYFTIGVMVAAGILLRSSPLPRSYLAVIYMAVGGALIQASTRYYSHLVRLCVVRR